MRSWQAIAVAALGLWLAACTDQMVVRPEGEFSWEPESRLAWPVQGAVLSAFGDAARPGHQGIDLAGRAGEEVAAATLGRVAFVGQIAGYGEVIVLTHPDNLSTVYAHLGTLLVREGDTVSRGQTIATIGKDGYLHYEIRDAKKPVDPAKIYAIAPQPLVKGSVETRKKVAREPAGVGMLTGEDDVAPETARPPPPEVARQPPPPPEIARQPPPPPPEIAKQPPPPPSPQVARRPPPPEPTPVPYSPPPPAAEPIAAQQSDRPSFALGAAVFGANLFYVPAKLAYAGVGGVTGFFALLLAYDTTVANDVWTPALGGDYVVTAEHLRGNQPLRFAGGG